MDTVRQEGDTEAMTYTEGALEPFRRYPVRIGYGVNILCMRGRADVSTGIERYRMEPGAQLLLFPGAILHVTEAEEEFGVRMFAFPAALFHEAAMPIDAGHIRYLRDEPFYLHPAGSGSGRSAVLWMDMARDVCRGGAYGAIARRNFMQGFLVSMCREIPVKTASAVPSRSEAIFHRFLSLVRSRCAERHDAAFYAGELCISLRYLRAVTAACAPGKTPKQLIDEQLVAEIQALLYASDLSVTQIADRLNFPDQSCLSRFFRRKTGFSPYRYRVHCRRH